MKTRTLGKSGLEISTLGFGCMGLSFSYDHASPLLPASERTRTAEATARAE